MKEQNLRKQFYNELEDLKGKIRVFCRVRPLNTKEKVRALSSRAGVRVVEVLFLDAVVPNETPKRASVTAEQLQQRPLTLCGHTRARHRPTATCSACS